ncbi:hypothetical protein XO10_09475 [Marinitoga sp. 1135]|uniref:Arabinose efflux permease family protein n=1 Tax=Marinitoga piezophila (strain DSM 14283 / JCM 11233 / KA3) TaxID=443254 RepID=H2J6F0_MARPK|nr:MULTISPECIES: MFS transporter [Marinitoga]AEX86298.1 arabinose efflux permease family protein [Marinitoga piezophila KA3]APT76703.1 hypothetical protein LN42_10170 [Marinitoga sp. 1137]NUU96481.1 hypothetical protein [Marinitoga sp. 1135]NUU98400.1 hypothetical protein [Marinitoga sp. 1138]
MDSNLRKYLIINSIPAFSFITILLSPMYASKIGLNVYEASIVFSVVYGIQAILTFALGHFFEKKSPNYGLAAGRLLFAIGNIILAFAFNSYIYLIAQIVIGSIDIFWPLVSMYERAIVPPNKREKFYFLLPLISEFVKVLLFVPIIFFMDYDKTSLNFYRNVFLSVSALNILYAVLMVKYLPFVKSGSDLHEEHMEIHKPNIKKYITVLLNQIIFFANFGFGSYLIISYYIKDILNADAKVMLTYEVAFSLTVLTSVLWKKYIKLKNEDAIVIGTFIMSLFYAMLLVKGWIPFYFSHVLLGIGFVLWISSKEPLKQEYAPVNFGRYEGLFNGIQLFSKIFTPVAAGYIASQYSYDMVFTISFIVLFANSIITFFGLRYPSR